LSGDVGIVVKWIQSNHWSFLRVDPKAISRNKYLRRKDSASDDHLKIEYTVCRKAEPICQSIPSELGGRAFGQDRHIFGVPDAGPIM